MLSPFTCTLQVRLHDLDAWQDLRPSSLLRYMEQAATDLSIASDFDPAWYAQRDTAWIMRNIRLQRLGPAAYADELTLTTWVSNSQRIRLWSEYEVRHPTGVAVAVGRAEWVYIDRHRRLPRPIDPAILSAWSTQDPSPLWQDVPSLPVEEQQDPFIMPHQVYDYDADVMGHTNNTVYADWLGATAGEALRAWGYPLTRPDPSIPQLRLALQFLEMQFLGPARPGETVTIATRRTGQDPAARRVRLAQEIQGATSNPLVRSETVYDVVADEPQG
jgi:acyl-CoA thioesterase FadM